MRLRGVDEQCMCYTEKAAPTRHRPEHQHNARANRRKQCSRHQTIRGQGRVRGVDEVEGGG